MKADGFIYFIKPVGMDGPVKIGYSICPIERLMALQSWVPFELEVIATFRGTADLEKALHSRFAKWQVRGEWFDTSGDLRHVIEALAEGFAITDVVDFSISTGTMKRRQYSRSKDAKVVGAYKRRVSSAISRASRVSGKVVSTPDAVAEILESAGGYRTPYREFTAQEIETLEDFIASCRAATSKQTEA